MAHASTSSTSHPSHKRGTAPKPSTSSSLPAPLPLRNLFAYSASTSAFVPYSTSSPPRRRLSSRPLRLLTYNTFSSSPGYSLAQTQSLLRIMRSARADILCLQEVSSTFEGLLHREAWAREFVLTRSQDYFEVAGEGRGGRGGKAGAPEAVIVMARKDLVGLGARASLQRLEVAPGERGKALVVLELGELLHLVGSHFTSLPENASVRIAQYSRALQSIQSPFSPATTSILLGDFNASSHEELSLFHPFLSDLYPSPTGLTASDPLTLDLFRASPTFGGLYPFVPGAPRSRPRKPRRIDRILVGGAGRGIGYEEIGREQVRGKDGKRVWDRNGLEGRAWPSDHLGVLGTIVIADQV